MPGSAEIVEDRTDPLQSEVFEDDNELLKLQPSKCIALLIAEVTLSHRSSEIKERILRLRDRARIEYILRRFGIHDSKIVSRLIDEETVDLNPHYGLKLIRVFFVHTKGLVEKYQKKNPELVFLSWTHAKDFIRRRSKYKIKSRGVQSLPKHIQFFIRSRQGERSTQ